jgi:hypothetical protein
MATEPFVMITNGGPHPAYKWAELSASEIIQVSKDADSDVARVGRRLELKFIDILEDFHQNVIAAEKAQLDEDGDGRLESPIDGKEHDAESLIEDLQAAAADTPFADHFKQEFVKQNIRNVVAHHAANIMAIERSYFATAAA